MPEPLYTQTNCKAAYQLRWSLALFPEQAIPLASNWLAKLQAATEADGVRVLEHNVSKGTHYFLVSTRPDVAPPEVVKSVKGRLQHAIRSEAPQAFRRNFRLSSIGDANTQASESYVANQLGHHRMADPRVDQLLKRFQCQFSIDLNEPQRSAHAEYVYNLHVVLVHAERWNEVREHRLQTTFDMILRCAEAKEHRLSRLALLADHIHLTVRVPYSSAPAEVALSYMNNIAFAHGMTPLFSSSFYVGTYGAYDMNAIRS